MSDGRSNVGSQGSCNSTWKQRQVPRSRGAHLLRARQRLCHARARGCSTLLSLLLVVVAAALPVAGAGPCSEALQQGGRGGLRRWAHTEWHKQGHGVAVLADNRVDCRA